MNLSNFKEVETGMSFRDDEPYQDGDNTKDPIESKPLDEVETEVEKQEIAEADRKSVRVMKPGGKTMVDIIQDFQHDPEVVGFATWIQVDVLNKMSMDGTKTNYLERVKSMFEMMKLGLTRDRDKIAWLMDMRGRSEELAKSDVAQMRRIITRYRAATLKKVRAGE